MIAGAPERSRIPHLRALWQEAFGDTEEFLDGFAKTAFSPDRCRCITENGTVVSALYWFDCSYHDERIAYLYAIATARSHRGRGLCRTLLEDTHRHLKELGYYGAILVPGSRELFDFYRKIGYQTCAYMREFCCTASSDSAAVRQIDRTEYAHLRRKFLPKDGVVQENENLAFLQTMANFYAGEDFLLTARCEADILYGMEWLGNTAPASAVAGTLGCTKGKFRTPGTAVPFAMYYPLEDIHSLPPSYFGLAFD